MLNEVIKNRNISKYKLAKNSGIPYSTLTDIINGKTLLSKCSAETVYKLSKELQVSMEDLLSPYFEKRIDFELFKSNVCHNLKELGDIGFIIETLEKDDITLYYNRKWYPECFYLLAMLDYVSRVNDVPYCDKYNAIRNMSLAEPVYPAGIMLMAKVQSNNEILSQAKAQAIPEFLKYNIVESDIRNVI